MNSQTSLVARQCRLQAWALQIKDCQSRPAEMTVNEWCIQNNITKANYYYRLKCVRQACLDSMESASSFIEVPVAKIAPAGERECSSGVSAVIRSSNGLCIELHDNATADFLKKLIGACTYAQ